MSRQSLQRRIARLEGPPATQEKFHVIFYHQGEDRDELVAAWRKENPDFTGALFVMPEKERAPDV